MGNWCSIEVGGSFYSVPPPPLTRMCAQVLGTICGETDAIVSIISSERFNSLSLGVDKTQECWVFQ